MLRQDVGKGGHQVAQSRVRHRGNCAVPVGALAEERVRPLRDRVRLQLAVQAEGLGRGAQQREQRFGQCNQEEQAIAPRRHTDGRRRQAQTEAPILGVPKIFFKREAPTIQALGLCPRPIRSTAREVPRVLHPVGPHEDDTGSLGVVGRHPGAVEFAEPPVRSQPLGSRLRLPGRGGHQDLSTEPDYGIDVQVGQERRQLLVAEATVGQDRHANRLGNRLAEAYQKRVFLPVPAGLESRVGDGLPEARGRTPVAGHTIEHPRGLVLVVDVGPLQRHDDVGP